MEEKVVYCIRNKIYDHLIHSVNDSPQVCEDNHTVAEMAPIYPPVVPGTVLASPMIKILPTRQSILEAA